MTQPGAAELKRPGLGRRLAWVLRLARGVLYVVVAVLVLGGVGLAAIETRWGKNQLRELIVREANQFLTATLEIDELEGSLLRGLRLTGIRLSRNNEAIVTIEEVSLSYSVRELLQDGTTVRNLRLLRPRVSARKDADGRWNLASLVRRDASDADRQGPRRTIRLLSIEVVEGDVRLGNPFTLGGFQLPTGYELLNASLSFTYVPVTWRLDFKEASWIGLAPDLTITRLSGGIANGRDGWELSDLQIRTPDSALTVGGQVRRGQGPATLDLGVHAERFRFQEWAGIVGLLGNMAVESAFDVRLTGPTSALKIDIDLKSDGGTVAGGVVLDTSAAPWRGQGGVDVARLDLARWLNRPDRTSDITGRVDFDLAFRRGFPTGSFSFDGAHARFLEYEADDVRATGRLTEGEALITQGDATAYGANVTLRQSTISLESPYAFRFLGTANGVDLRQVPASVPIPHVESVLAFAYDVSGQFASPFIRGGATLGASTFIGAEVGAGSTGSLDTSTTPFTYKGSGFITGLSLPRLAREIEIDWLRDPRYSGSIDGRFSVEGTGGDATSMVLRGGGRVARSDLFGGVLSDADVTVQIEGGSLKAYFNGRLATINPALALNDPRAAASLSGTGWATIEVKDLLVRPPTLADYTVSGDVALTDSVVRDVSLTSTLMAATLQDSTLDVQYIRVDAPVLLGSGSGRVELDGTRSSWFDYEVGRADLGLAGELLGRPMSGEMITAGRLTGPTSALSVVGEATATRVDVADVRALTTSGRYDITFPLDAPARATARFNGRSSFVEVFGQQILEAAGTVDYRDGEFDVNLDLTAEETRLSGTIAGAFRLRLEERALDLLRLELDISNSSWRLLAEATPPTLSWDDDGLTITPLTMADRGRGDQRVNLSGSWRTDGRGALQVAVSRVALDPLASDGTGAPRYGGFLDAEATITGNRQRPTGSGRFRISEGRVQRVTYRQLEGRLDYADGIFEVNLRLDQSADVWLTAAGTVPLALFSEGELDLPINISVASSPISLGLIEGLTGRVTDVSGQVQLNISAVGTGRDPHLTGTVELTDAAFAVAASGARYRNGRVSLRLVPDQVTVEAFRLEDRAGRTLVARGSIGTHELKVADVSIEAQALGFEILRNEFGTATIDTTLTMRGQIESPRLTGVVTIVGGVLNVNAILDRTLLQPYSSEPMVGPGLPGAWEDVTLTAWERLGIDVELRVPNTMRFTGDNLQVTPGTPLGLGDFNVRALGDLYLYKDPAQPLYVTGSLDSLTGTYAFQGRRFTIDPISSVNFRGDLNPELYITVEREISGVRTQVTVAGPLDTPELRLASTPPLDPSDILSLIIFNTSTNQLSSVQQQELAVRAGTLAAGFLAAPLMSALQRSIGLDTLEIEQGTVGNSARVTIGAEIAPGLVARFSRQFGASEYDEATIEYYLSRILRLRGTFSDAGSLSAQSPFRRVERAGIDLLLFFSF